MKRRWKILISFGITVIAVVVAAPLIARLVVLQQLSAAGWPHATVEKVQIGWNSASVRGLDLTGTQQATARRITTDWLLNRVVIDGLVISLPDADWQSLLPLPRVPQPLASESADAKTPFTWPIGQLSLIDSSVTIGAQHGSIAANIVRLQPDRVQVTGTISLDSHSSIAIDGSATLTGDGDLHLQLTDVPLTMLPPKILPGSAEGTLTSDLRLTRTHGTIAVAGDVSIHQPGYDIPFIGQVHADHVGGRIRWTSAEPTSFNGDLKITTAHATLFGVVVVMPSADIRCADQRIDVISHLQAVGADVSVDGHCSTDFVTAAGTARIDGLDLGALAGLARPWMSLPITAAGNAGVAITFTKLASAWRGSGVVNCTKVHLETEPSGNTEAATRLLIPNAVTELSATWIDNALSGTAVLRINHAQVNAPGIQIASIDGTLPWSIGTDPQLDGSLQFTGVEVYGFPLRQLAAHVRGVDRRIGGAAYVGVLDAGRGRIDGWYDLQKHGGTFGVVVPRFTILDPAAVRKAVPAMGSRDLTGEIDLSGTVVVADNQVIPDLRVSLAEGLFVDPTSKLTVNGLAASTVITGFTPFSTAGTKQVAFRSATIGSLVFGDGTARLTARFPVGVDITEASIAWCGGRIKLPELAVDLQKNSATGTVELARVELGALLRATIPKQMSGEGLISGTLPLTLTWPDYIFSFGRGSLQADPASGWLHLKDRTALVSAIATGFAVVDTQIVDTVADLMFDGLRVDFVPETPLTSVAKIRISGRGRNGDPPLALGGLDLNVRGLERALADALFMQRWQAQVSNAQAPDPSTIDRFFSP